jgi:hypothetical protein
MVDAIASVQQTGAHSTRTDDQGAYPDQQDRFPPQADLEILSKCGVQGLEISP